MKIDNLYCSKYINDSDYSSFKKEDPHSDKAKKFAAFLIDLVENFEYDIKYQIDICNQISFIVLKERPISKISKIKLEFIKGKIIVCLDSIYAWIVPTRMKIAESNYFIHVYDLGAWNKIVSSINFSDE